MLSNLTYAGISNTFDVALRAVKERVYYVKVDGVQQEPPRPNLSVAVPKLHKLNDHFDKMVARDGTLARWDLQRVVSHYTGQKRKRYEAAKLQFEKRGIRRQDANVSAFLKFEKVCTDDEVKEWVKQVCRLISPRKPIYALCLGRYLLGMEKVLLGHVDRLFDASRASREQDYTIMKGLTSSQIGECVYRKSLRFVNPVWVMLDATRYDQHINQMLLSWEHSIYLKYIRNPQHVKDLATLLSWQLVNKCSLGAGPHLIKYISNGGRASGDINTSMGNCLIMSALVNLMMADIGIQFYEVGNNGDDTFICMSLSDYQRFAKFDIDKWWVEFGITMRCDGVVTSIYDLKFCQTKPFFDGNSWIMVRDIRPVLSKDCCSIKPLPSQKLRAAFLWSIGKGGLALSGGVPILDSFYRLFIRSALGVGFSREKLEKYCQYFDVDKWNLNNLQRNMNRENNSITTDARISCALCFGFSFRDQHVIEQLYNNTRITTELEESINLMLPYNKF